jgi:hypothetical protein
MVIQKCCPSLRRFSIPRRFPHPAQYGRSETSKPSIFSSPWIGGEPQVGFSATRRKRSLRS